MEWSAKTWETEDEAYAPKRRVNNKGSRWHPHIIGSFYSYKNQKTVEFESLNERMFYYFLEIDLDVARYYVQPIRVPMMTDKKEWVHVPDVLVFRERFQPLLFQIKENESDNLDPHTKQCNLECELVANLNGWVYNVVFPKTLPTPLPRNINFLTGYLRTRNYYGEWYDQVIYRMRSIGSCTVDQLSSSFSDSIDPLFIKPLVYHLIATGHFLTDVRQIIGSNSVISINSEMKSPLSITDVGFNHEEK